MVNETLYLQQERQVLLIKSCTGNIYTLYRQCLAVKPADFPQFRKSYNSGKQILRVNSWLGKRILHLQGMCLPTISSLNSAEVFLLKRVEIAGIPCIYIKCKHLWFCCILVFKCLYSSLGMNTAVIGPLSTLATYAQLYCRNYDAKTR